MYHSCCRCYLSLFSLDRERYTQTCTYVSIYYVKRDVCVCVCIHTHKCLYKDEDWGPVDLEWKKMEMMEEQLNDQIVFYEI